MSVGGTSGTSGSNSTGKTVDPSTQGFNGLNSQDFLKLLITELQNQDPTQPMDNSQLLQQLSQMRNLQASIDLDSSLGSLTMSQQLNAGSSFLGKTISGTDANSNPVTGVVSSVLLQNNNATLVIGDSQVPLANVTGIAPGDATPAAPTGDSSTSSGS